MQFAIKLRDSASNKRNSIAIFFSSPKKRQYRRSVDTPSTYISYSVTRCIASTFRTRMVSYRVEISFSTYIAIDFIRDT